MPSLLSDSETLDEGFETQSNVSETVEPTSRSCPLGTISNDINETKSLPTDENLADELTRRLTFTTTRRLSHDSNIRNYNNNKRTSLSHGRPANSLKTSTSAYSYPTFASNGQQNQTNKTSVTKRTPSAESVRSMSNSNSNNGVRSSRNIQRCAVSRRLGTEKDTDETSKSLTASSSPASSFSQSLTVQNPIEPDEISSSSTLTTTTTKTNTTSSTATTITNHRISSTKAKTRVRNLQTSTESSVRSYSPIIRRVSSRLGHANSCQNVSTTTNSPKPSLLTKPQPTPNFYLNSNQILRSSFSRPNEKPLRVYNLSNTPNNESISSNRTSSKARRLFSSNTNLDTSSTSSPKNYRKPPSSWHHQKSAPNKTSLTTVLPSSNLNTNRKSSTSTVDLRKNNPVNSSVFQRVNHSKRL